METSTSTSTRMTTKTKSTSQSSFKNDLEKDQKINPNQKNLSDIKNTGYRYRQYWLPLHYID